MQNGHHWLGEVTGVQALVDNGLDRVPDDYVRPEDERPKGEDYLPHVRIPLIDLSKLYGPERASTLEAIHQACKEWGFLQVVNHGIPVPLMDRMTELAWEFFAKPLQEKQQFKPRVGVHPSVGMFGSSLNYNKKILLDWRDALRHRFPAGWESLSGTWPDSGLTLYKETLVAYRNAVTSMADRILCALAENLGLPAGFFNQALGRWEQYVNLLMYPRCPEPDRTLGIKSHTDGGALALLQQDAVGGLQVLKNGRWVPVEPIPYGFVVNVGDTMQALTNDTYQSVAHRVVVNMGRNRLSIITHITPEEKQLLTPATALLSPDEGAAYRSYTYEEYLQEVFARGLDGKNVLSKFRLVQT